MNTQPDPVRQFDALLSEGKIKEAAKYAVESAQLRTAETIQKFQALPSPTEGGISPILQYFHVLLQTTILNAIETVEVARPAAQQGKLDMLRKWWDADKLEASQELGDLIWPADRQWGMAIYVKASAHSRVIQGLMGEGQYDSVPVYAENTNYVVDYMNLLTTMIRDSLTREAVGFSIRLIQDESGPLLDVSQAVELFMSHNLVQETTAFLLEALKYNRQGEGQWQTRLLEINLQMAPQVANTVFENGTFSHYDRAYIARLCEQAGLYQRALEHYTDLADVKRLIVHTNMIPAEVLLGYFGTLSPDVGLECLKTLLAANPTGNAQLCAQVASQYCAPLGGASVLVPIFQPHNCVPDYFKHAGQFDALLASGQIKEAAQYAAGTADLRTTETIQKFQALRKDEGGVPPILQYFAVLKELSKLNKLEATELAKPAVQQGKLDMLRKWWDADKLEASQELGDLIWPADRQWGMAIYIKSKAHARVVVAFVSEGQYDKVALYAQKTSYVVDYPSIIMQLVQENATRQAVELTTRLMQNNDSGSQLDMNQLMELFLTHNLVQETTAFLLEALKNNRPEEGQWQTRLLEINLQMAPQVANTIFENGTFSHYDRAYIARLCEQAGLYQRALEHYTDLADVKRLIVHTNMIPAEVLLGYFGTLSPDVGLECLKTLLAANPTGNAQLCAQVATGLCQVVGGGALVVPLMIENAELLSQAQDAAEERDLASLDVAALRDEVAHLWAERDASISMNSALPALGVTPTGEVATVESLPLEGLHLKGSIDDLLSI